jgi:uncharacterized protein
VPARTMPKRRPDHQPQRTCAVCRTVRTKREMQRIVRSADGDAVVDPSGRMPGRGTYVCADPACQANPSRERAIARALGIEVTHATA